MNDRAQLRDIASLFSKNLLMELAEGRLSQKTVEIVQEYVSASQTDSMLPLSQVFEQLYSVLATSYRCEYLYKNSIAIQLLCNRHPIEEAIFFTEFDVVNSKADALILNGTSTIYEIKTELDTLERLDQQLADYCLLAEEVYVVSHHGFTDQLIPRLPSTVGYIELSNTGVLELHKSATSNEDVWSIQVMFNALRKNEVIRIIERHWETIPSVPNTDFREACFELVSQLSPKIVQQELVRELKLRVKTQLTATLLQQIPSCLTALCFVEKMPKNFVNNTYNTLATRVSKLIAS